MYKTGDLRESPGQYSRETKRRVVKLPLRGAKGIEPVPGFNDRIYKYEEKPRTMNDYLRLAKMNEHDSSYT